MSFNRHWQAASSQRRTASFRACVFHVLKKALTQLARLLQQHPQIQASVDGDEQARPRRQGDLKKKRKATFRRASNSSAEAFRARGARGGELGGASANIYNSRSHEWKSDVDDAVQDAAAWYDGAALLRLLRHY